MKTRKLKVEQMGDNFARKTYPAVRLKGHWLRAAGFVQGDYVELTLVEPGCLKMQTVPAASKVG